MPTLEAMFAPSKDNAVLLLSLLSAIIHIPSVLSRPSYPRTATKTASTALLALLAHQRGASRLLTGALALGSLGDFFLAWDGDANFLRGLASFLTAHVLYVALLARTGGGQEALLAETWRAGAATFFAVVLTPGMAALLVPRVASDMRAPIVVYSTVIATMVVTALTLDNNLVISGAVLFTTSDAILSLEKFVVGQKSPHSPWMRHAVWALYYTGQLLIALGFVPGG